MPGARSECGQKAVRRGQMRSVSDRILSFWKIKGKPVNRSEKYEKSFSSVWSSKLLLTDVQNASKRLILLTKSTRSVLTADHSNLLIILAVTPDR